MSRQGENLTQDLKSPGFKGLAAIRAFSSMASRLGWGRLMGSSGKRNYESVFGWDLIVTSQAMRYMYNRGGIAKRVVDAYPDAIWGRPPILWVKGDEVWNKAFAKFAEDFLLWSVINRADKLAGLGEYSIVVLGGAGSLDTPMKKGAQPKYIQPYGQDQAEILEWNTDQNDPNFGRPKFYQIKPQGGITGREGTGLSSSGPVRTSFRVHFSRVLHIAQGNLDDEVYGQPRMAPVWDYLCDLRKVVGSSSESYWIMANRGLQADVDKDMALSDEDASALSAEVDEYFDGFRRFIRTKGVEITPFKAEVADPKGPFDVLVTLISGTLRIPKRILSGSEAGQLASSEDKGNWAEAIEEQRTNETTPKIVKPMITKLIGLGILPEPQGDIQILWPDAYRMSPLERGMTAAQTARSLANVIKGSGKVLIKPAEVSQVVDPVTGVATTQTVPAEYGPPLITRDEARAIIGLSTDNRVLAIDPDV